MGVWDWTICACVICTCETKSGVSKTVARTTLTVTMVFNVFCFFYNLRTVPPKSTAYTIHAFWDGARISDFLKTVATNSKVFLRGLRLRRKKKILARGTESKKKIGMRRGNHAFFRDNLASNW